MKNSLVLCATGLLLCMAINCGNSSELPSVLYRPCESPTPWLHSREELLLLLPQNAVVLEMGAEAGAFSKKIFTIAKPSRLYLVDCWEPQPFEVYPEDRDKARQDGYFEQVKKEFARYANVEIIKGFSDRVAKLFPDNFFDWVYIDGNHTYDAVKLDLETWFCKVKDGGYITGHDYFLNGASFGVVPAVNEFLLKHNLSLTYLTVEAWPSYVIKIKKDN